MRPMVFVLLLLEEVSKYNILIIKNIKIGTGFANIFWCSNLSTLYA